MLDLTAANHLIIDVKVSCYIVKILKHVFYVLNVFRKKFQRFLKINKAT